jgi:hypothetical protein
MASMRLTEREFVLPRLNTHESLIACLAAHPIIRQPGRTIPLRFVITDNSDGHFCCELGLLEYNPHIPRPSVESIFSYRPRRYESQERFIAVMVVPTGIGALVGGHAGDAAPAARLLAACADTLITHPNVVNAADINEMSANTVYVEGSVITRLMMGTVGLAPRRSNRILTIVDCHDAPIIRHNAINSVNAARASAGLACERIAMLSPRLTMTTTRASSGRATGVVEHLEGLLELIASNRAETDAVAITSVINMDPGLQEAYFQEPPLMSDDASVDDQIRETINPFGGVEALLTHCLSSLFDIPTAHAPMYDSVEIMNSDVGEYEPRKAAEAVSVSFLHCVLKGLSRSPAIITDPALFARQGVISNSDISCLVIPDGCIGLPTLAALEQRVPVIAVKGNKNAMRNDLGALPWAKNQLYRVENYWEAAGVMMALKAGVPPESVRRPIAAADLLNRAAERDDGGLNRDLELDGSFGEAARLRSSG